MQVLEAIGRWLLFRLTAVFIAFALLSVFGSIITFAEADSIGGYAGGVAWLAAAALLAFLAWWGWRLRERSKAGALARRAGG